MAKQQGWLMIDHRASPGLTEEVSISIGLDPKLTGEGKLLEADTLTCSHCKTVVMKNPLRIRERYNCPKCNFHYICDFCAAAARDPDYNHFPYDKLVDVTKAGKMLGSPPGLLLPKK